MKQERAMAGTADETRLDAGHRALAALSLQLGAGRIGTRSASSAVRSERQGCCQPVCEARDGQSAAHSGSDGSSTKRGPRFSGSGIIGGMPRFRRAALSIGAGSGLLVRSAFTA